MTESEVTVLDNAPQSRELGSSNLCLGCVRVKNKVLPKTRTHIRDFFLGFIITFFDEVKFVKKMCNFYPYMLEVHNPVCICARPWFLSFLTNVA